MPAVTPADPLQPRRRPPRRARPPRTTVQGSVLFRPLSLGLLGASLLRLCPRTALFACLLLPLLWELRRLPALLRSPRGRLHLLLFILGLCLGLPRLAPTPETGSTLELNGRWEGVESWCGACFRGRLKGYPRLSLRGLGERGPAPGSSFRGRALILPSTWRGEDEARLLDWSSEAVESRASAAFRLNSPGPRLRAIVWLTGRWPDKTRPLARALLLGDRSTLASRTRWAFRDAGLAHLLALSGLHVGLFLLLLRRLLGFAGLDPARSEWLLLVLLPVLPFFFGGGPSIRRAAAMAGHLLLQRRLGGRARPYEALAFAACLELLLMPAAPLSLSFQLSYGAVLMLIATLGGGLPPMGWPRRMLFLLRKALAASHACNLATLPVCLLVFSRLPLGGPLWNLAAGPLCALGLGLGWTALPWLPWRGLGWLSSAAAMSFGLLQRLAQWGAASPLPIWTDFRVPDWTWALWSLGLLRFLGGAGKRLVAWTLMLMPALLGRAIAYLDIALPPFL